MFLQQQQDRTLAFIAHGYLQTLFTLFHEHGRVAIAAYFVASVATRFRSRCSARLNSLTNARSLSCDCINSAVFTLTIRSSSMFQRCNFCCVSRKACSACRRSVTLMTRATRCFGLPSWSCSSEANLRVQTGWPCLWAQRFSISKSRFQSTALPRSPTVRLQQVFQHGRRRAPSRRNNNWERERAWQFPLWLGSPFRLILSTAVNIWFQEYWGNPSKSVLAYRIGTVAALLDDLCDVH